MSWRLVRTHVSTRHKSMCAWKNMSAHIYPSCGRVGPHVCTDLHKKKLSCRLHKDPSSICGEICKMIITLVSLLIFIVICIFSQLYSSKVFKDEQLLSDNRIFKKCKNTTPRRAIEVVYMLRTKQKHYLISFETPCILLKGMKRKVHFQCRCSFLPMKIKFFYTGN